MPRRRFAASAIGGITAVATSRSCRRIIARAGRVIELLLAQALTDQVALPPEPLQVRFRLEQPLCDPVRFRPVHPRAAAVANI